MSRTRRSSRTGTAHFCLTALAAAFGAAACSSAPTPSPAAKPKDAPLAAGSPKLQSPARYVLTQSQGAIFDEGNKGVAVPRSEAAIVAGRRVTLESGVVVAAARTPSGLVGFRSLPAHLGGGYLVWSDLRTYHGKSFLGELTPVAEIGPMAGARPWFSSLLLRTDRGIFELDLKARTTKRWTPHPGVADALAIDEKRGVTLDAVGRVRATTDGGATWTDVTAARGFFASAARLGKKGEIELLSLTNVPELRLPPGGVVEPIPPPPPAFTRRYYGYGSQPYSYSNPSYQPEPGGVDPISQTLAPESLAWATTAGLLLAGDRAIVAREEGVQILSTKTGAELDSASLLGVETRYAGCQPVRAGASVLLACAHTEGAQVLVFDGPLASPKLEATFPGSGSFIADERGHLAFAGRCGRTPPSADDFGGRVVRRQPDEEDYSSYGGYGPYGGYNPDYPEPSSEEPVEPEKPPADDKRICVRLEGGHWIEHRLTGDDARDLYRWVLGEDGVVTALLLKGANPDEEENKDEEKGDEKDGDDEDMRVRRKRSEHHAAPPNPMLLAQPTARPKAGLPPRPAPTSGPQAGPAAPPKTPAKPGAKSDAKPEAKPNGKAAAPPKPDAKKAPAAAKPVVKDVPTKDGLRLVRLNPKERALKGGKWTHVAPPLTQAPWRSVEQSFWLEDGGSVRGWVRLLDDGVSASDAAAAAESSGEKPSPVASELSGRFAGVRISPQGKATVLPLPAHVQSVIFGGRFGFARAEDDGGDHTLYYETTDGGATWTEVEGPPVGEMDEPYDDSRWPACSALGCTLAGGLVRLGWGSPKPTAPKKEKDSFPGSGADTFPVARLPRLECRFDSEPETFPAAAPKPTTKPAAAAKPSESPKPGGEVDMPPDARELIERMLQQASLPPGLIPPGLMPPGLGGTASPAVPPAPAAGAKPTAKPAAGKPPIKAPPAKAPPPPPAELVSLRTKPQSALGQLKDKSWSADFVVPFDPTAPVKHVSATANGLEKLTGTVVPLLGDRGVDLLLSWPNKRTVLGSAPAALLPFDYGGRLASAAIFAGPAGKGKPSAPGTAIVALDEERRVLVLVQADAARAVLRTAKIPDPTRGHFTIARRTDAPGVALVWYSATSGDVLVGAVDFGRAEIGPLAALAPLGKLLDGGLPQCAAPAKPGAPEYEFLADVTLAVTVTARSEKVLFTDSTVPSTVLVRATTERACVAGVEVRGGGRPLDLSASFGPKGAAVARSRSSAEDPTKLALDKLSCLLKEPQPR